MNRRVIILLAVISPRASSAQSTQAASSTMADDLPATDTEFEQAASMSGSRRSRKKRRADRTQT